MLRLISCLAVLICLPGLPLRAQADPAAPAAVELPPPVTVQEDTPPVPVIEKTSPAEKDGLPPVVREKTIYVPHEKLDEVFEKAGRGVFLPYEEFLKLWKAAQPTPTKPDPDKPPADAVVRGGQYVGKVTGDIARFEVTFTVEGLKKGWSELPLPLGNVAVESVTLDDADALFSAKGKSYVLMLPRPGKVEAKIVFSVRVQSSPGKKALSFSIPPVAISHLKLTLPDKDARITVEPQMAATHTVNVEAGTELSAFVGNASNVTVSWTPPAGKVGEDAAVVFAEQSLRSYLGERILRLSTDIVYNVVRGEVGAFSIRMPADLSLLSVKGENIRVWDQKGEVLSVSLHSPVKDAYTLSLQFERILSETPKTIAIPLPAVQDVRRETGWLALSHDAGLKVRVTSFANLSQHNPEEIPEKLRSGLRVGFRYMTPPPPLGLAVTKIKPVVRTQTTSVIVLQTEEDLWVGHVDYTITKAGLFQLQLRVPARWNVKSIGDPSTVEDYQAPPATGQDLRVITINLKNRALGKFRLPFHFTANSGSAKPGEPLRLVPPRVDGTERDQGIFGVTAPRSLNLEATQETGVRSAEPETLTGTGIMGQVPADVTSTPQTYTYRQHSAETPAAVTFAIASKKRQVDVSVVHRVEVSDKELQYRHYITYAVQHREVENLRFTAPAGLKAEDIKCEGLKGQPTKKDAGAGREEWTLQLAKPGVGNFKVTVERDVGIRALNPSESIPLVVPLPRPVIEDDIEKWESVLGIRKAERCTLEIEPRAVLMEPAAAENLPSELRGCQTGYKFSVPTRKPETSEKVEPDPALTLNLTKYEYATLATTAVNLMYLKSVLSDDPCQVTTRATLVTRSIKAQNIEVMLPGDAKLLELWVGPERITPKKRDKNAGYLVPIPSSAGQKAPFHIVVVYEQNLAAADDPMGSMGSLQFAGLEIRLEKKGSDAGPEGSEDLAVPVQRIELDLWVPTDYTYYSWAGMKPDPHRPDREMPEVADVFRLPTQGLRRHRFASLADQARLAFRYAQPGVLTFLSVLVFLVVLVGGLALCLRTELPVVWTCLGAIAIPIVIAIGCPVPVSNIFWFGALGGVITTLACFVLWVGPRFSEWRKARLALAPDPYLEEAADEETEDELDDEDELEDDNGDDIEDTPPPASSKKKKAKRRTKKRGTGRPASDSDA